MNSLHFSFGFSFVFIIFGSLTAIYLKGIQPNLINKKTSNHINIINNTIDHIKRLKIQFNKDDVRKFLFSTRFLFQNLDRVIFFDNEYNLVGDTDTLDLDQRLKKRIRCREVDHFKIDYDPSSGEQNAFKLAYAHLKTNSKLSSVSDA